jgi:hypothetical protein
LKAGDQSFDLLLYDKGKLKKRAAAKPKTGPNVVGVSVKPKAVSQVTGLGQKLGAAPQMRKSSAKSTALNANRTSNLPLPVKKGNSDAAVPKNR